jgi:hypothetical protein
MGAVPDPGEVAGCSVAFGSEGRCKSLCSLFAMIPPMSNLSRSTFAIRAKFRARSDPCLRRIGRVVTGIQGLIPEIASASAIPKR